MYIGDVPTVHVLKKVSLIKTIESFGICLSNDHVFIKG